MLLSWCFSVMVLRDLMTFKNSFGKWNVHTVGLIVTFIEIFESLWYFHVFRSDKIVVSVLGCWGLILTEQVRFSTGRFCKVWVFQVSIRIFWLWVLRKVLIFNFLLYFLRAFLKLLIFYACFKIDSKFLIFLIMILCPFFKNFF